MTSDVLAPAPSRCAFDIGATDFLLNGEPFVIRCGEMHFARIPSEYWRHRLKMARAMGLNTVCAYLFWNFHEWEEGRFAWSGWADVAKFCRMAKEEGLWILVRPGPYSCAEWEMGGLPWWLLKRDGIGLRTADPAFLEPATRYLGEVARVLAPLQVTRGGPILMVQVENEYGSFGKDAEYMGALRQALIEGGIDVPLFACNPPGAIEQGWRDDLFQVVNFGQGSAEKAFAALAKFQKTGPLMNGEFYPAWFDMWGVAHRTTNIRNFAGDLEYMLRNNHSFSIYMAHGGTSFGLWAGADRPFRPDTSSYDYDAPISEAGWATDAFHEVRELFARHLSPGEELADCPPPIPVTEVPVFALEETAPFLGNLPMPQQEDGGPRTMEFYGQSRGCILYRTKLPAGASGTLEVRAAHDFAWVFVDGKVAGVMDRRSKRFSVGLPERSSDVRLDILVEAMGRVNFGAEILDRKGLHGPVCFTPVGGMAEELKGWEVFALPLDEAHLASLNYQSGRTEEPAFWRGSFEIPQSGDTFLDVRAWGKGVAWVNGHCLGRFWNIGPTQTMYCPGAWLKKGPNEVVVLDLLGPKTPELAGLAKPILADLRPELDFIHRARVSGTFSTARAVPAAGAQFTPDVAWQVVTFPRPVRGRYFCLEALDSLDGEACATVAELDPFDARGESLPKTLWKVFWVSSEETSAEPGHAENALDGQPSEPGRIKNCRFYVSDEPFGLEPAP